MSDTCLTIAAPGEPSPHGFDELSGEGQGDESAAALDSERLVLSRDGVPLARAALRRGEGLVGLAGATGLVGHYEASDREAGTALLREAARRLASTGARRVLGPMDGSTWRRYRLALPPEPDAPTFDPPWFAGEPRNPPDYPLHFEGADFVVDALYESRIESPVRPLAGTSAIALERASRSGVRLRTLDPARFDEELRAMFRLSLEAFRANLYYTPIAWEAFRAIYESARPGIDPRLVWIAESRGGAMLGYLFGYPDPPRRPVRSIAKTLAVDPAARGRGVGALLLERFREATRERGLGAVVHALMHVRNASTRLSARHASVLFRRYALYRWEP